MSACDGWNCSRQEDKADILRMAIRIERFQALDDSTELLSQPILKLALYTDFQIWECGSLITSFSLFLGSQEDSSLRIPSSEDEAEVSPGSPETAQARKELLF